MALEFTKKIALGYTAPNFSLLEPLTGKRRTYHELKSKHATVVMFICNHCPYVKYINEGLVALANEFIAKGVVFIAINSNDADKYPDDSPEMMIEVTKEQKYPFVYLFDASQQVAKDYHAVCTPDFSIFNYDNVCVYRGQMDEARPGNNTPVSGDDMRIALNAILKGDSVNETQVPSAGCSIKWK